MDGSPNFPKPPPQRRQMALHHSEVVTMRYSRSMSAATGLRLWLLPCQTACKDHHEQQQCLLSLHCSVLRTPATVHGTAPSHPMQQTSAPLRAEQVSLLSHSPLMQHQFKYMLW